MPSNHIKYYKKWDRKTVLKYLRNMTIEFKKSGYEKDAILIGRIYRTIKEHS